MEADDAVLVARCKEGDTDAFGALVSRYQTSVYATAYYYVGKYNAAEDVSQDAFLAAYKSLPRLKYPEKFGPWLKEVTCRTAANWLRRHGKRLKFETPLPYKRTISIEDAKPSPRKKLEHKERLERVQRAIDSLPERYRLPVMLRYMQELSYEEIGCFTGDTKDEIRGIMQHASRQLRTILAEPEENEGDAHWRRAQK
jgi:RNA polymerase sigma-70 factor, ECF subfamily